MQVKKNPAKFGHGEAGTAFLSELSLQFTEIVERLPERVREQDAFTQFLHLIIV